MRIEVGNYRTKSGYDVTIVAVDCLVAIGYRIDLGPKHVEAWDARSGRCFAESNSRSGNDIIVQAMKIRFEKWATLYREANGGYYIALHNSLSDAKLVDSAGKVAITKIVIDCEEGENLD